MVTRRNAFHVKSDGTNVLTHHKPINDWLVELQESGYNTQIINRELVADNELPDWAWLLVDVRITPKYELIEKPLQAFNFSDGSTFYVHTNGLEVVDAENYNRAELKVEEMVNLAKEIMSRVKSDG